MWNTFKYTLLFLTRERHVLIWALAFPLILATMFYLMFANLDEVYDLAPIPTALITDTNYEDAEGFSEFINAVSEGSENEAYLDITEVNSVEKANELLLNNEIDGYITVSSEGQPRYLIGSQVESVDSTRSINRTLVKNLLDAYIQNKSALIDIGEADSAHLAYSEIINSTYDRVSFTEEIQVTANDPKQNVRFFYALLGFSAIMAANIGLVTIALVQPNTSLLGARRNVAGIPKFSVLASTLLASWFASFVCLLIAFIYIRFVLGVDFGGHDAACILALAVSGLVSTTLGAFVGAIPKLKEGAKASIMTGISCFMALYAGLYGVPSQQLADDLARTAPLVQMLNPARQVSDAFYSLFYYTTYDRFVETLIILLAIAAIFFAAAAVLVRRHRYASI